MSRTGARRRSCPNMFSQRDIIIKLRTTQSGAFWLKEVSADEQESGDKASKVSKPNEQKGTHHAAPATERPIANPQPSSPHEYGLILTKRSAHDSS